MWPSALRNAAAVILATALTSFGAWTQTWPCDKTSWPQIQTNGSATAFNEDLWLAWKERVQASGNYPSAASSSFCVVYIQNYLTNTFTSNSWTYTNIIPVWKYETNYYRDAFPTNWGKYRVLSFTVGGGWMEPMTTPERNAFALSNGSLPVLSWGKLGEMYPPAIMQSIDTNTRPASWQWVAPEYNTNTPVALGAKTIYNGFQDTNGWKTSHNSGVLGLPSENPCIAFWQVKSSNAPNGTFKIVGTVAGSTSLYSGLSFSTYTQTVAASWATNQLASNFISIISVTNTGASTGVCAAIFFPSNSTRTLVTLTGSNAQATAFNFEWAKLRQYQSRTFPCYAWIPYGSVQSVDYEGQGIENGSNNFVGARSKAYPSLAEISSSVNTQKMWVYQDDIEGVIHAHTNDFDGDEGTYAFSPYGVVDAAYAIDYMEIPLYPAGSNETVETKELVMGATNVFRDYMGPGMTNGTYVEPNGTSFYWYTWAKLNYTKPGADIVPRCFLTHTPTGYWETVTSIVHTVSFAYGITDADEIYSVTNNTKYQSRATAVIASRDKYMKGTIPIFGDWTPAESLFPTGGPGKSFEFVSGDAAYHFSAGYTRP